MGSRSTDISSKKDKEPETVSTMESTEDVEQIGKDVIIGRKDVRYEDGKNVISVIINAISVRINMPRGTVKALMACFVILLLALLIYACNSIDTGSSDTEETAERSYADNEVSESIKENRDIALSQHYSYTLPKGSIRETPHLGSAFVNAQAFSFTNDSDEYFVVRSFMTWNSGSDLESAVRDEVSKHVDIENVRYDSESFDIGDVVVCRYDTLDSDENRIRVVQYFWEDSGNAICSLEVSGMSEKIKETARSLMETVRYTKNDMSNEELLSSFNYVKISRRFWYELPDGLEGVYDPYEVTAENETFCEFTHDGVPYTIRSYLLPYTNDDLEDIVKASLSEFTGVEYLDEEYIEGKYGRVLKIRFEVTDEDGTFSAVTGYYWSDIDPYVCCMEIISDSWQGDEAAEMVLDSVYRTEETQSSPAPDNAQELYDEQRKEDAMDSLVDDAMDDNYDYEPEEGAPL